MKKITITMVVLFMCSFAFGQTNAIKVERNGNGRAFIFLPGFATPGEVWNETVQNLDGNWESFLISYAGFDGLQPVDTPWYPKVLNAILTYIDNEHLDHLSIIGHSMGGNLAVDIAARIPDKVDNLILVDALPCMRAVMMPGVTAEQIKYNSPYNQQMLNQPEDAFNKMAGMYAKAMASNPDKIEQITEWIKKCDRKTYCYGYTDLLKLDLRNSLSKISARTLILGAPNPSKEIAKKTLMTQYANLTNKTISMADKGKHFIMFDQPEWFYEKVNAFLDNE